MSKPKKILGLILAGILVLFLLMYFIGDSVPVIDKYTEIARPAVIYPDYTSTVIAPDIAPLNFMVKETGSYYLARIYCDKGEKIEIYSKSPKILIPIARWHKLLDKNRAGLLYFDIFVRGDNGNWVKYQTITNKIAAEDIASSLVYRRMHPPFNYPLRGPIGVFERDLKSFDEKLVLDNHRQLIGCVNCHTFCDKRPEKVVIGVRNPKYGAMTLFIENGSVKKIGHKLGYTAWHPGGRLAVFSNDKLPLIFHTARSVINETIDLNSTISCLATDSLTIKTSPELSRGDRLQTWPVWSADGRWLYYCSAPKLWNEKAKMPPDGYDKIKYDLVRIGYDIETDTWGQAQTVIAAKDTGLSIAIPKTSPDGRWLTFCMLDYGFFPPWHESSDLYIADLNEANQTGRFEYRRLDISSDNSESWQSWSSNSRWIVFSSKKEFGSFTKSYLSYIDRQGHAHKPLIIPQKDPEFYTYSLDAFNTPELITGSISISSRQLENAVFTDKGKPKKTLPEAEFAPGQAWKEIE